MAHSAGDNRPASDNPDDENSALSSLRGLIFGFSITRRSPRWWSSRFLTAHLGVDQSTVRRRIQDAENWKLVHIVVHPGWHHDGERDELAEKVRATFDLEAVRLVRGAEEAMSGDVKYAAAREAVLIDCEVIG